MSVAEVGMDVYFPCIVEPEKGQQALALEQSAYSLIVFLLECA